MMNMKKVCIVGASGKLGQYMVQHALDRDYEVVGVCREKSVPKLDSYKDRITIIPGPTNDRQVIKKAVEGCDGVLTVLVPWGVNDYSSGTAQAVLDYAQQGARLIFSCGWHITMDGQDIYPKSLKVQEKVGGWFGSWISTARWKRPGASMPAIHCGRSCAAAISRRGKARACPCGAGTWAIPSWRVISRAAWILRCSWWRRW